MLPFSFRIYIVGDWQQFVDGLQSVDHTFRSTGLGHFAHEFVLCFLPDSCSEDNVYSVFLRQLNL